MKCRVSETWLYERDVDSWYWMISKCLIMKCTQKSWFGSDESALMWVNLTEALGEFMFALLTSELLTIPIAILSSNVGGISNVVRSCSPWYMFCRKGLHRRFTPSSFPLVAEGKTKVVGSRSLYSMLCGKGLVVNFHQQPAPWWQREELKLWQNLSLQHVLWKRSSKKISTVNLPSDGR